VPVIIVILRLNILRHEIAKMSKEIILYDLHEFMEGDFFRDTKNKAITP
jgi:hypothetical protein